MNTMFVEMGAFTISLVFVLFLKTYEEKKNYRDCLLFSRLLLATMGILFVDTVGWIIDGKPLWGQVWITTVVDGLDLILTTTVCWCWVQYALYIADGKKQTSRRWYKDFSTYILLLQIILVSSSQLFHFYYSVDAAGVYHREAGYFIHTSLSLILLVYSSGSCLLSLHCEKKPAKRREKFFAAFIILIPVGGNIFQLYVYGYPTVWLCMVFVVLAVYIHIQNKRINLERKEQNEALKEALVQAQAANIAKNDFLARMSHDMRTPMNGILGLSYLMENEENVDEIKKQIPKLREAGEYLLQLINDVLDVNRVESGNIKLEPKECDEELVFKSIISMVQPLINAKSIELDFKKINIQWTYMMLDVERVKQIFVNLLTNAIKFTPEGGHIDFIMELVSEDQHMIRDKFIIRDNGIGMSEEYLPNAFTPFSQEGRVEENLGGTGLGLSIVKNLVELMGGNIEVKSKVNEGTEFTLYLNFPLAPKRKKSPEKVFEKNDTELPANLKILLCEDHALNAEIATKLLEHKKAIVTWKENGQLGVDAFEQSQEGEYDAILMDIRMPVLDGIEATKKIRALNRPDAKTIPIIAMTANAYPEDVQKSLAAGMNEQLSKPIEPQKIFEALSRYTTR